MQIKIIIITVLLSSLNSMPLFGEKHAEKHIEKLYSFQSNLNYTGFEQQIKSSIGEKKSPLLTDFRSFSLQLQGNYHFTNQFYAGVFARFDQGARILGSYTNIQANGTPEIAPRIGGNFHEFWLGPAIGYQLKYASAEVGYGVIGLRKDTFRDDIKQDSTKGEYLSTSATVAWQIALNVFAPFSDSLSLNLRFEYRVRYYEQIGDTPLRDNVAHGTQDLTPFLGLRYTP